MSTYSDLQLITGNRTYSASSLRTWLLLKEFEIPFYEIRLDLFQSGATEQLGLYSPSLKVPVLIHNDIKVWDSLPICEYISESFLENRGWPMHMKKKAAARSVCAELHADFHYFNQQWPFNCNIKHKLKPDAQTEKLIARLDAIMYCCRTKYGDGGEYLFGQFSIADCFLAPFVIALHSYGAELSTRSQQYLKTLQQNPHMLCWLEEADQEADNKIIPLTKTG